MKPQLSEPAAGTPATRRAAVAAIDPVVFNQVDRLIALAPRGLERAHLPETGEFAQTLRPRSDESDDEVYPSGTNLRYAGMAALGLSRLPADQQRQVLAGRTAADVTDLAVARAAYDDDPGAVAMAAWAAIEVTGTVPRGLLGRLAGWLGDGRTLPTVDLSWLLTAAVGASTIDPATDGSTERLVSRAADRLLRTCGSGSLYPHLVPSTRDSRPGGWRAHVGSFADQVYPVQALARAAVLTGDPRLLAAADRTAARLCRLQGPDGQWWWHYDVRTGEVVERYPVYSVHQHAMAPMALLDLLDAGGGDHRGPIATGLRWLDTHPEVTEELVEDRLGVVWRKVGRREPRKAARALNAAVSSFSPHRRAPGLDRVLPPRVIDRECRPYELGWLLYAWLPRTERSTDRG